MRCKAENNLLYIKCKTKNWLHLHTGIVPIFMCWIIYFLNSFYTKAEFILECKCFLLLCCMCIFVYLGQERLTDRSISKCYAKRNIAPWVELSSTSTLTLMTHDSIGHLLGSAGAFIAKQWHLSLNGNAIACSPLSIEKTLVFEYESSFMVSKDCNNLPNLNKVICL